MKSVSKSVLVMVLGTARTTARTTETTQATRLDMAETMDLPLAIIADAIT